MIKIATLTRTKNIIKKHGFFFSKSLGQNFLIDANIPINLIKAIGIDSTDNIIEIGPGIGSLTQVIAEYAKKVVVVEIDKKLIPILEEMLSENKNVEIIHDDILKIDLHKLMESKFNHEKTIVIGNLPYYITTPIIMRFLEEKVRVEQLVFMVQKEVAERMQAKPSTKQYGTLSIAVQYYCDVKTIMKVPPTVFLPQPKVESSVITLDVLENPRVNVKDSDLFFGLVKDAFGKRRKTLLNTLSSGNLQLDKIFLKKVFNKCGIDGGRRGETLSIEEFAILANTVQNH
ncbi:MAG: 16S rRNA (adenine(1518)-N(6)/adenine(1519)-N(6))-dimethyltransferase RsmA [Clostridiales bacterium]|nr:16S rRNA (adenine(1518)-N(6)/adenine(1519)-N(6))-dimethyltransferase RsmA [Clostridiales bacterium]